jgi:hypothetical protein
MEDNMPQNWDVLSWQEKRDLRLSWWRNPKNFAFASPDIENHYKTITQLFIDALMLRKPARVPIRLLTGGVYVSKYAGFTVRDIEYHYDKMATAYTKFNQDFSFDTLVGSAAAGCGRVYDLMDMKFYHWPGHGVGVNSSCQAIDDEYMQANEYDDLIADPTAFFLRSYFPRIFGALLPFQELPDFTHCVENVSIETTLIPMATLEIQQALHTMIEAGRIGQEWIQAARAVDAKNRASLGRPSFGGGFSKAPFDVIGDTLRGSRGIMLDMFRQPGKLIEACDRITTLAIRWGLRSANATRNPFVSMPLHKGADSFMSRRDFEKFYWPSLKEVIKAYIRDGCVPVLFAEGSYNERLDTIVDQEIPAGSTIWMFEQTDMNLAKRKLGGYACIHGNVPASLISTGTPQQIKGYVKNLLSIAAQDGGFILSSGAVIDDAKAENLNAMLNAGWEFGSY